MLIKTSFGAKGTTFGCVKKDVSTIVTYLKAIEDRLRDVVIENKDFETLITDFSKKKSLFYLELPYYGTEKYYDVEFTKNDHARLFSCIQKLKAKFILTYNDCEYIRDLYKDYSITEVQRYNNLTTKRAGTITAS